MMSDNEEMQNDPIFGDWGASQHNNGKGIRLKLTFYPLDNPAVSRRKNARCTQINAITQVHKDYGLREFIIKCLDMVERCNLLEFSGIYRYPDGLPHDKDEAEDKNSFDMTYDIQGTGDRDIRLCNTDNYKVMMTDVYLRKAPSLWVTITELEVAHDNAGDGNGDEEVADQPNGEEQEQQPDEEEEEPQRCKKHRKTLEGSVEEEEQNDIIISLQEGHVCEDRTCANYGKYCVAIGPDGRHVTLTPLHFRVWSAAMQGCVAGVSEETPPHSHLFEPKSGNDDETDISLLAKRRLQQSTRQSTGENHVHMSFDGLANFICGVCAPLLDASNHQLGLHTRSLTLKAPLPPKMSLVNFCNTYELSDSVYTKLLTMDIDGPHLLRKVSDGALEQAGKLTIGQVAAVRDAEEQYLEASL
ncbi:hypothetical protein BDN71DRAFT_1514643 [Pleurotus eryngii]|uniref:Uncharacterized protein n=1 Tax=Pleurotus eryngii TaxID=5323 RepID=A0A9P5ZG26_PLEER|nr:hypothetical protein BDN71DRAFT_1514643 [Pleurotus eryngii]